MPIGALTLDIQHDIVFQLRMNIPGADLDAFVGAMQQVLSNESWITTKWYYEIKVDNNPPAALLKSWSLSPSYTIGNLIKVLNYIRNENLVLAIKKDLLRIQQNLLSGQSPQQPEPRKNACITVCIITAKNSELEQLLVVFNKGGLKLTGPHSTEKDFVHYQNENQQTIRVFAAHSDTQGVIESAKRTSQMINAFHPDFVFMTGVCAGKRYEEEMALGDLLIATESHTKSGKMTNDGNLNTTHYSKADEKFVAWVRGIMEGNKEWKYHPNARISKPSKDFQKDFILRAIYDQDSNPGSEWLIKNKIDGNGYLADSLAKFPGDVPWPEVLSELKDKGMIIFQQGKWKLINTVYEKMTISLAVNGKDFPSLEIITANPKSHFVKFGVENWVRVDETVDGSSKAFTEFSDYSVLGLDMESASVYTVCEGAKLPALVIKGVSDFADSRKDNRYHEFGKQLSAGYVLEIMKRLNDYKK